MKHTRKTLKESIRQLEIKQEEEKEAFNLQLKLTFESLKPSNLLKSTLRDFSKNTLEVRNTILEAFIPLITNFISGKLTQKGQKNSFFRLLATMLQVALTNFTAKHSHSILNYLTDFAEYLKQLFVNAMSNQEATDENDEENQPEQDPDTSANDVADDETADDQR